MSEKERINGIPRYAGLVNLANLERTGVLKNGAPTFIERKATETISIENPHYFVPSFGEYKWPQRKVIQSTYNTSEVDRSCRTDCILPLAVKNIKELVAHILAGINNDNLYDYLVMIIENEQSYAFEDEMFFIDMVSLLDNYGYSVDEISQVMYECLKIRVFQSNKEYDKQSDVLQNYYQTELTKIDVSEGVNWTRFYLPDTYTFLDDTCQSEFNVFNKDAVQLHPMLRSYYKQLSENAKIFLFQSCPQNIISYDNIKKMFIELILPQEFLFSPIGERVYIPDYLVKLGSPLTGRNMVIKSPQGKNLDDLPLAFFERSLSDI